MAASLIFSPQTVEDSGYSEGRASSFQPLRYSVTVYQMCVLQFYLCEQAMFLVFTENTIGNVREKFNKICSSPGPKSLWFRARARAPDLCGNFSQASLVSKSVNGQGKIDSWGSMDVQWLKQLPHTRRVCVEVWNSVASGSEQEQQNMHVLHVCAWVHSSSRFLPWSKDMLPYGSWEGLVPWRCQLFNKIQVVTFAC